LSDLSSRLSATGRLLVRSSLEMRSALRTMQHSAAPVTASLESGNVLFLSRLLLVDEAGGSVLLACSEFKHANSALLASRSATFSCNHGGVHYEFSAGEPREVQHQGQPAIALSFPSALMVIQRRSDARFVVPPSVPLSCKVSLGPVSFDARIVDISAGGLGALVYDAKIALEPGMHLRRTRIRHPERSPVLAELEVRYVTRITLPGGLPAHRAGCKFVAGSRDLEDLVRLFVTQG